MAERVRVPCQAFQGDRDPSSFYHSFNVLGQSEPVLRPELLVMLVRTTCQDRQDTKAAFGTSEAIIAHSAMSSEVNIHYFSIMVSLFYVLHKFCSSFDA